VRALPQPTYREFAHGTGTFDDRVVERTRGAQRVGHGIQHVAGGGRGLAHQAGEDGIAFRGKPLGQADDDDQLTPDALGSVEQHAVGLDARAVVVSEPVERLAHRCQRGAGRRPRTGSFRHPGRLRELAIEPGEGKAFRPVPT